MNEPSRTVDRGAPRSAGAAARPETIEGRPDVVRVAPIGACRSLVELDAAAARRGVAITALGDRPVGRGSARRALGAWS